MSTPRTNIRQQQPDRRAVRPGHVFTMQLPDETYLLGRVVSTTASWTVSEGAAPAILIHVHRNPRPTPEMPDPSALGIDRLLIQPTLINRLPWSRGYFRTIGTLPLDDLPDRHCFRSLGNPERYYDDRGIEMPGPVEPVGLRALSSYRVVDDLVSTALGIPLAPPD